MVKFIESVIVENHLRKFNSDDYYNYNYDENDFSNEDKPLIYSSTNYDIIVISEGSNYEVLIDNDYHEYYKVFKNKKAAVRYAELIIDKLNNSKSTSKTALELGFKSR